MTFSFPGLLQCPLSRLRCQPLRTDDLPCGGRESSRLSLCHPPLSLIEEPTMPSAASLRPRAHLPHALAILLALLVLPAASRLRADQRVTGADFKQAYKYSPEALRPFVYSTAVLPNWIGKTDVFWYEYRTAKGKNFYRVNPKQATREPLFNAVKLATLLSEMTRKPLEPSLLPLFRVSVSDDGHKMKFVTEDFQYEYDLRAEKLVRLGKAPIGAPGLGGSPAQLERLRQQLGEERFRQLMERR